MKPYFSSALLFVLTACTLPAPPAPPPRVTLTASVTAGEVPLTVTFSAAADPQTDIYSWTVGGEVQAETSSTFTTTFTTPGLFVVSVSAAGESDSVAVVVRSPELPDPDPDVTELELTQTPGGPAPWGVAYTVDPAVNGVEARCTEGAGYERVLEGRFVCLHEPGDEVAVRFVNAAGEVTARAETPSEVTQNDGVAFAGRWRYRSRGVTETFEITEGGETLGRSADGRFVLFTIRQRGATIAEFTIDGRTVVLEPTPDADGRQVFEADVYGLVLEAVTEPSEDGSQVERPR